MLPITDEEELLIDFVRLHNRLISRVIHSGINRISLDGCVGIEQTVAAAKEALAGIVLLTGMMEDDSIARGYAHGESWAVAKKFAYAVTQLYTILELQDGIPPKMADKVGEIHSEALHFMERADETGPFMAYEDEIPF